jgi:hypothetical protein
MKSINVQVSLYKIFSLLLLLPPFQTKLSSLAPQFRKSLSYSLTKIWNQVSCKCKTRGSILNTEENKNFPTNTTVTTLHSVINSKDSLGEKNICLLHHAEYISKMCVTSAGILNVAARWNTYLLLCFEGLILCQYGWNTEWLLWLSNRNDWVFLCAPQHSCLFLFCVP